MLHQASCQRLCPPPGTLGTTASPSSSPSTENSAVTPSASVDQEAQAEILVNQQIQDFLNKEGNFSNENIQQYLINYNGNKNLELGFVEESPGTIFLQGWFFDYARVGDYLIMKVGFEGVDGKNHVKPVAIPIKMYERSGNDIPFNFLKMSDWKVYAGDDLIYKTDAKSIIETLDLLKGHPVKLGFPNSGGEFTEIQKKQLIDLFGEEDLPLFENAQEKTIELASEVTTNESIKNDAVSYSSSADFEIPNIDTFDNLHTIDLSKVPFISIIGSNLIQ